MDRLLTVDDLKFVALGGSYPDLIEGVTTDNCVKFRVRTRENGFTTHKRGYITRMDLLHGTPTENAQNIADTAGMPCEWVNNETELDADGFFPWKTCEPSD